MAFKQPIRATRLRLAIPSATLVIGLEDKQLIFPALDLDRKLRPPERNMNLDAGGPPVVSIRVDQIQKEHARREDFGWGGVERLSLCLPPEQFSQLLKHVREIRSKTDEHEAVPLKMEANLDEEGTITRLTLNDQPMVLPLSSEVVGSEPDPVTRASGAGR